MDQKSLSTYRIVVLEMSLRDFLELWRSGSTPWPQFSVSGASNKLLRWFSARSYSTTCVWRLETTAMILKKLTSTDRILLRSMANRIPQFTFSKLQTVAKKCFNPLFKIICTSLLQSQLCSEWGKRVGGSVLFYKFLISFNMKWNQWNNFS